MPCFTLVLTDKDTVYRLSEMISTQFDVAPGESPFAMTWREITIQASHDNVDKHEYPIYIKGGCADLSGLRYGYVLGPGESRSYRTMGSALPSTSDKYFLCEAADNVQLSVELL